jgi:hypothetical protein
MSQTVPNYRWSVSEFVRAWEAGAFEHRVELIEGELWPVLIAGWHGRAVGNVTYLLRRYGKALVSTATLPSGDSLPDPDCWVQRPDARPREVLGSRMEVWAPDDVLLVVEVSDATKLADLMTKARIYGSAGYAVYWVVTEDAIYEHTEPTAGGYRHRTEYRSGEKLPLAYAGVELSVDELIPQSIA